MADSNITKKALAAAMRELMEEMPFEKINVAYICEKCGMNRKSFYYHFKDKYDLVNWIFDTDFIAFATENPSATLADNRWEFIENACDYFYENRSFYRKVFLIKGQNSFSEHFQEYILPLVKNRLTGLIGNCGDDEFILNFFSDAILCAIERWLLDKKCMPPERFVSQIKYIIQNGAIAICEEIAREK